MGKRVQVQTYMVEICIAGDAREAENICRRFCMAHGFCVTVTPTTYVYTGGAEAGVIVRCINYPRFPSSPDDLWERAEDLAQALCIGLFQHSFTVIAPDRTIWVTDRDQ